MKVKQVPVCKVEKGLVHNSCQCCGSVQSGPRHEVFMHIGQTELWCPVCFTNFIDEEKNSLLLFTFER